jgi:hypothetical protein
VKVFSLSSLGLSKVTSSLKGPVDPEFLLNFQIVDQRAEVNTPTDRKQPVATLVHPLYNESAIGMSSSAVEDIGDSTNDKGVVVDSSAESDSPLSPSHANDFSKKPVLSLVAKRMGLSARRTRGLQGSGLATINQQIVAGEIKDDPILHGYEEHYNLVGCWRSPRFGVLSRSKAVLSPEQPHLLKTIPRTLSRYLKLQEAMNIVPVRAIPPFDFKKYSYARRTYDNEFWPVANTNAISSKKSLAETLTYGPVMMPLALEGIIPVVCFPNPKDRQHTIKVPFGPLLDLAHNPIQPGVRFQASVIYNQLRMKNAVDHHDAWHSYFWSADGLNLRLPPKSGLPVNCKIIEGHSPIGELLRIDSGRRRLGFRFHGSGGNPVINGLAPPDAKARKTTTKDAAEGATFETPQSVLNKMNQIMQQICESGRPLKVFLSGDILPKGLYDKDLEKEIGVGTEQSVYMGMYDVEWCGQDKPLLGSDLLKIVEFYKEFYPDLKRGQLRFQLAVSKQFLLVPNQNYEVRSGGYQHLEVDIRDNRKPIYEVPRGTTIDKIFRGLDDSSLISEVSTFVDWVDGRGYLELVETPYMPVHTSKQTEDDNLVGKEVAVNTALRDFEAKLRPFDPGIVEERVTKDMACRRKRSQTMEDHFEILILCSLGAFARMCLLNVDSQLKIGPLIDYVHSCHGGVLATLVHYIGVFGSTASRYLSHLGRAVQMSPTTHPIRTYDPKVLLLMLCNCGAKSRKLRQGRQWLKTNLDDATNLFFHCIIIEVIKVEVLVEWSLCFHGAEASRLPILSEIPCLLDFVAAVLQTNGASSTRGILHDQYLINDNFKDPKMFIRFFQFLQTELAPWFSRQLNLDAGGTQDLFGDTNKLLTKFINSGIVDSYTKQPFHCQHMLLNLNEVVDLFPFGKPVIPVVGFGGNFGAQLLQDKEFKSNDAKMVRAVMNNLLEHYSQRSPSELLLLGLKKERTDNCVTVAVNGRPLGVCDPEHGCCIQYPVLERASGGSKGMSRQPLLVASFCHPIKGCNFQCGMKVARKALAEFKGLVDRKKWKGSEESGEGDTVVRDGDETESEHGDGSPGCDSDDTESVNTESHSLDDSQDNDPDDNTTESNNEESSSHILDCRHDNEEPESQILNNNIKGSSGDDSAMDVDHDTAESNFELERWRREEKKRKHTRNLLPVSLSLKPTCRPCNLMLAMIFGGYDGTPEMIGNVKGGTSQLRRDTARCVATERHVGKDVYTLDNRQGAGYPVREDRHMVQNLFKINLAHPLMVFICGHVHQICLDYFWFQGAYWGHKLKDGFFHLSLPKLHGLLLPNGCIYLGLSVHLLLGVLKHQSSLEIHFHISLVHETEVEEIDLVKGSHQIPQELYANFQKFGGKDQNPEAFLGTSRKEIRQNYQGDTRSAIASFEKLADRKDPEKCRFIKLTNLKQ